MGMQRRRRPASRSGVHTIARAVEEASPDLSIGVVQGPSRLPGPSSGALQLVARTTIPNNRPPVFLRVALVMMPMQIHLLRVLLAPLTSRRFLHPAGVHRVAKRMPRTLTQITFFFGELRRRTLLVLLVPTDPVRIDVPVFPAQLRVPPRRSAARHRSVSVELRDRQRLPALRAILPGNSFGHASLQGGTHLIRSLVQYGSRAPFGRSPLTAKNTVQAPARG